MSLFTYALPLTIWVGTLIVCLLCVYAAWRSFFGDRGTGKRRCPKCWYDLAYSPGMTCGECGHTAQDEREFTRTRRRPFVALSAISICVTLVLGVNDQMNQKGIIRHIPTGLLIWSLPIMGGMDSPVGRDLDRRATQRQLTQSQWERLVARCASGDWLHSPPSAGWVSNYGNFITNWRNRFIGDPKLEASLLSIPPRVDARTREAWPVETPIVVAVRLDDWWPSGMECRVRATPRLASASARESDGTPISFDSLTFFRGGDTRFRPSPYAMYLPPLPAGDHEIVIDFAVERRRIDSASSGASGAGPDGATLSDADNEAEWEPVGTHSCTITTRIEGTLAEMSQPVSSEALNMLMAQVFGNAVRWVGGGRSPVRFGINAPVTFDTPFDDTAVGVSVELVRGEEVARRLNLWWIAGADVTDNKRNYGFEINHENLELLRQLEAGTIESDGWVLRIRSDPALALRAGKAERYWQGEFTTPINLRVSQTQAPPRMWWTEGDAVEPPKDDAPESRRGGRRSF